MDKQTQREDELRAAGQAAEWLDTLEQARPEDHKDFAEWLARSPVHVQEFLTMTAIDRYLDHVPADYPLNLSKLRGSATGNNSAVTAVAGRDRPSYPRRARASRRKVLFASAASLIVAAGAAAWWVYTASRQNFSTGTGEQRTVELQDGSVVYLNARSRIETHLTDRARDVYLTQGEALFKVKHEAQRPFRVHAERTQIQAVGTQFNVYRRKRDTMVAVLEGAVRISTHGTDKAAGDAATNSTGALSAGEEALVVSTGEISVHRKIDVAKTLAWRERRLVFDETSLPEIVAEFNRYNRELQLQVDGENAARRRFTGAFDADDPESLVALLKKDGQLQVERSGRRVMIR